MFMAGTKQSATAAIRSNTTMPDTITTHACGIKDAAGKTWLVDRYHRTANEAYRTAQRYRANLQLRVLDEGGQPEEYDIVVWPETRPVGR